MNQQKEPQGKLYAVYGTLRQGFGNYKRLLDNKDCTYLGTQRTSADFKMVSLGGFPGVIPGGDQEVTIEVFQVNNPQIEKSLDYLEGYPRFYQKMTIKTNWGKADMYILSEEEYGHLTIVKSGDWSDYVKQKRS